MLKNWCFGTVMLEKTLVNPLDCEEIQWVYPKGNQYWIFTGMTDAEAETSVSVLQYFESSSIFQYFGHLMWRTDSLEKTLMLGKTEGRRIRGWQRTRCLDDITDLMDMSRFLYILTSTYNFVFLITANKWQYSTAIKKTYLFLIGG